MADNDNKPEVNEEEIIANSPFAKPISVKRNGVIGVLQTFVGSRGEWENQPYAAFQLECDPNKELADDEKFLTGLTFIGKENLLKMTNVILRRYGQDNVKDAIGAAGTEQAGIFSMDTFVKSWEDFTAAAMRIGELKELLDREQKLHTNYIATEGMRVLGLSEHGLEGHALAKVLEEKKLVSETIKNRTQTINSLRFQLEARQKKTSKEAAVETVSND